MKIAVAMSGGVDSSVSALLLKEQGHDVFGISMLLYAAPGPEPSEAVVTSTHRCCGDSDIADARSVAAVLNIPFYVANMRETFRQTVVQRFADAYAAGSTPIPCIDCNVDLKFRLLLDRARAMGADALATGHYARIESSPEGNRLLRGRDLSRDQSYYLYNLSQRHLEQLVFPVGELPKPLVRERARQAGLPVFDKPDSQEICFVTDRGYAEVVEKVHGSPIPSGPVQETNGNVLGQHEGIHHFTVGQRRGLGVATSGRRYVTEIRPETATVVVGTVSELMTDRCRVTRLSWIGPDHPPSRAFVQIRAQHRAAPATLTLQDDHADVHFSEPQRGVAPGQAAVFYDGPVCLGGGVITRP